MIGRNLPLLLLAMTLAACKSEHKISLSQFSQFAENERHFSSNPLLVDGDPVTGTVTVVADRNPETIIVRADFSDGFPDGRAEWFNINGTKVLEIEHWGRSAERKSGYHGGRVSHWRPDGTREREIIREASGEQVSETQWCDDGDRIRSTVSNAHKIIEKHDCASGALVYRRVYAVPCGSPLDVG